ncbi:MAG: hypothetical protein V5A72_01995, partial [Candidatus Nanohaloarchaea archaeon]
MKFKLFGKLRDDDEQSAEDAGLSGGSLERTVENMFQQGYSEEEIRNELEDQYSPAEISRAVNDTVTSSATDNGGPQPMTPYQEDTEEDAVSPMDEGYEQGNDNQNENQNNMGSSMGQSDDLNSGGGFKSGAQDMQQQ